MSKAARRIVTGHDENGRARFRSDESFDLSVVPTGDAAMTTLWTTATVPADLNDEMDGREREAGTTLFGGSVIRIVEMLPGGESPMHRTNSIDYGVVLSGDVELELDDGIKTLCGPGDVIVQRGTMHRWRNPSQAQPCRIAFILIEASPYCKDGQPLEEMQPH